jgi:hypothetical protein
VFIGAVLIVPSILPGEWLAKPGNLQWVVKYIVAIVPVALGLRWRAKLRSAVVQGDQRDSSIRQLVDRSPTLENGRLARILGESVGKLPWLECDGGVTVRCNLFGAHRDHPLALLECDHSVSVLHANGRATITSSGSKSPVERWTAEGVVFFRPLRSLPDLFVSGANDPFCRYFKRWLKRSGHEADSCELAGVPGADIWSASSEPEQASALITPELAELLVLRPGAVVQVMGGFCVVIPRMWSCHGPSEMARDAFEIEMDLDFACAVYEALRSAGQPAGQANRDVASPLATS